MRNPIIDCWAALLHHQGLSPDAVMKSIRDSAANPGNLAKLGLGNVDAAAAVKSGAAASGN
ncbi:hypothetical protein [Streptomyces sp. NPDC093795]|uniref:hypothetical protein n=1 Tax=Streptomyces sp. NPDC093795 TaxID=3366051 RepID=UPI0037F3D746